MSEPRRTGKIGWPKELSGVATTGKLVRLLVGQTHGFIRLRNGREVFFHRADLQDPSAFNRLQIDDVVTFELIDDSVSGARAIRVARTGRK